MKSKYQILEAVLEVTLACNMRCLHCGSSADGHNRKEAITFEQWCKAVDELNGLGIRGITLSGGEPFLYPRWRDLLLYINKVNPKIIKMAITNAFCLKEDDIKFLKSINASHIAISIDGDEEVHDYIRQTKGSFKKSNQVMDWCDKYGIQFSIVTSINKHNFPIREKILAWALKRKPRTWQVQIVNSFGRAGDFKDSMLISKQQYAELCEDLVKWHKKYQKELKIFTGDSIGYCNSVTDALLGEDTEWQGCNAGIHVLGIEANGNVKGCLSLQDDSFIAGNIKDKSLTEIWNDDSLFPYSRGYDSSKMQGCCAKCECAERCKAGCLNTAFSIHGSIHENSYCYRSIKNVK